MPHLAHIRFNASGDRADQTVSEHSRACAEYASSLRAAGLMHTAYLAGLLHDLGKARIAYEDYLTRAARGEDVVRGSVNHTFAGVRFVMERWHEGKQSVSDLTCELLAAAIGGHHGLFDCIGREGEDGYARRMEKEGIGYEEAKANFLSECAGLDELDELFEKAKQEVSVAVERCKQGCKTNEELFFSFSLLQRMLLSAVLDGDRRDTAEFMNDVKLERCDVDKQLWLDRLEVVERALAALPEKAETAAIDAVRRDISARCRHAATRGSGVYALSVPTGGGKTLTSLRYALATAAEHNKKRLVIVTPLLSVLDQNAREIRKYVNADKFILEHHSNVIREKPNAGELNRNELMISTWDAPVVVTTLVQLLNSLFAGRTSCIRRMSALQDSVIVVDEVQSVPRKMLSLFTMAMNFLANVCGATIVLCSATQPCLDRTKHAIANLTNLIDPDPDWWQVFERTRIIDRRKLGGYTVDELAQFAVECQRQEGSLLLICNTKSHARKLYRAISAKTDGIAFHLSTSMCMEHRVETLEAVNAHLDGKRPVICVSTQLVEAGVDFSFACVIRVAAGLDNIIQAAGRCNRGGEFGRLCPVYVVNIKGENLTWLKEIRQSQLAAESVMEYFRQQPDALDGDLASEKSITAYYSRLYTDIPQNALDYPLTDGPSLFTMLSTNGPFLQHCKSKTRHIIAQAFKTAGDAFRVFDDDTTDVLVPYGAGESLITDLCSERAEHDFEYRKELLEKASRYTISLYDHEIKALRKDGGIRGIWDDAILVLDGAYYDKDTGFCGGDGRSEHMGGAK